jgi:hypothetical protein
MMSVNVYLWILTTAEYRSRKSKFNNMEHNIIPTNFGAKETYPGIRKCNFSLNNSDVRMRYALYVVSGIH